MAFNENTYKSFGQTNVFYALSYIVKYRYSRSYKIVNYTQWQAINAPKMSNRKTIYEHMFVSKFVYQDSESSGENNKK